MIKGIQIEKEEVIVTLFAHEMIVYINDPKNSIREPLKLIDTFSKIAGYKINPQNSVALLYSNNKQTEKEVRETAPFTTVSNKIFWGNSNQSNSCLIKSSWTGRYNMVGMAILPKASYRVKATR